MKTLADFRKTVETGVDSLLKPVTESFSLTLGSLGMNVKLNVFFFGNAVYFFLNNRKSEPGSWFFLEKHSTPASH